MHTKIQLDQVYAISEDLVARKVQGEFIIVPLTSGISKVNEELFTLNPSGLAIWEKINGKRTLGEIIEGLCREFSASKLTITKNVLGLMEEFSKRKMVVVLKK
jgi:hypothetical protein